MFFDTHAHLNFDVFTDRLETFLEVCIQQGVSKMLIPGVDEQSWGAISRLSSSYPCLYAAFGMHPLFIKQHCLQHLSCLERALRSPQARAVGEIGLDKRAGHYGFQQVLFERQLELAERIRLPVVLHCVKAHDDMLRMISKVNLAGGVIHAFSGSCELLERYTNAGLHIGVGGVITRESAQRVRGAIAEAPLECLVLETDSPDMKVLPQTTLDISTPLDVKRVFEVLCDIREESPEVLERTLWENSLKLFAVG